MVPPRGAARIGTCQGRGRMANAMARFTAANGAVTESNVAEADPGAISRTGLMVRTIPRRDRAVRNLSRTRLAGDTSWCYKWRDTRTTEMEFGGKLKLLRQIPYFGSLPEPEPGHLQRACANAIIERAT